MGRGENRTCNDGSFWGDRVAVRKIIVIDEEKCDGHEDHAGRAELNQPACSCPSAALQDLKTPAPAFDPAASSVQPSRLGHWPVQLMLVPPNAPFIKDSDTVVRMRFRAAADSASWSQRPEMRRHRMSPLRFRRSVSAERSRESGGSARGRPARKAGGMVGTRQG